MAVTGCLAAPAAAAPTEPRPTASASPTPRPDATPTPAHTATPTRTPSPTPTPPPPEWRVIAPGIQRALIPVPIPDTDEFWLAYALRMNPERIDMRVLYDGEARDLPAWQEATGAAILFNGSFFTGDPPAPVGRIVSDGFLYGGPLISAYPPESSVSVTGMFTLLEGAPEMFVGGREAYTPREMQFDQALECYPVLLLPGGQPNFDEETGNRARRTVIALDEAGFIVVLVVDQPVFSLYEIAHWLPGSGLALDTALNLDGGRSSGIAVALPNEQVTLPAYVPLPIVVAVNLR